MSADEERTDAEPNGASGVAGKHLAHNIGTIAELHARAEQAVGTHQKLVERLNASLGRPRSLYVVVGFVVVWVSYNLAIGVVGMRPFDPAPFFWLQGIVTVSALLMTIMILTTQNRQMKHSEQRAHLDLQINLLAEQKIAKLVDLLEELRRDLPNVRDRVDLVANAMTKAVDPQAVMSQLEQTFEGASSEDETRAEADTQKGVQSGP